ncbi:MliC family protein [Fodinibius sp.]|uniref:MliC family protein n=1 Tax=Fodinibius sp. TaxID=1872440 RepID=UPI002ACD2AAE|nr:MliC family protein [Fodinibius sp.]MDZ7659031.1 MliC family protein [Fodinibius sp.]
MVLLLSLAVLALACEQQTKKAQNNTHISIPNFDSIQTDQVFVYNCSDTLQFTAHVTKDSTWLFLSDTTLKVLPVKAGSGARYEGKSYMYWSKGSEAILQKPQGSFMTCQSVPEERSWAAAKLRGVDFRALGQEPGWFLELKKEGQLKYVGNYGNDTLTVKTPTPEADTQGKRTVYRSKDADQKLKLVIADTPCTDSMSGFDFPQTVMITVNGKTYRGCGRYL